MWGANFIFFIVFGYWLAFIGLGLMFYVCDIFDDWVTKKLDEFERRKRGKDRIKKLKQLKSR